MDSLAHHGKCMQEFPLASWRELLDHSSLPLGWICWHAKRPIDPRLSRSTKEHMYTAWTSQISTWHQFQHDLEQQVGQLSKNYSFDRYHTFEIHVLQDEISQISPHRIIAEPYVIAPARRYQVFGKPGSMQFKSISSSANSPIRARLPNKIDCFRQSQKPKLQLRSMVFVDFIK